MLIHLYIFYFMFGKVFLYFAVSKAFQKIFKIYAGAMGLPRSLLQFFNDLELQRKLATGRRLKQFKYTMVSIEIRNNVKRNQNIEGIELILIATVYIIVTI